jgi:hypothetical protein
VCITAMELLLLPTPVNRIAANSNWTWQSVQNRLPNSPFRPSDTRDYDGLQNTGPEYHDPPLCRACQSKTV